MPKMSLESVNYEKYKINDKTPYFKNHLKIPIIKIEGSNMDQTKQNYLKDMKLLQTYL